MVKGHNIMTMSVCVTESHRCAFATSCDQCVLFNLEYLSVTSVEHNGDCASLLERKPKQTQWTEQV